MTALKTALGKLTKLFPKLVMVDSFSFFFLCEFMHSYLRKGVLYSGIKRNEKSM